MNFLVRSVPNNIFTQGYRKISVGKSSEVTKLVSLRVMEYT